MRPMPLDRHVLGWASVRALDSTFQTFVDGPPAAMRAPFFEALGLPPAAGEAIDGTRPAAVALLDHVAAPRDGAPPVVLALPARSRAELEAALSTAAPPMPSRHPGITVYTLPRGSAYVSFVGDVAFIGYDLGTALGAPRALGPVLARARAPLHVHVNVAHLARAPGGRLESLAAGFLGLVAPSADDTGELAYRMRQLVRVVGYLKQASSLDLTLAAHDRGLELLLRLEGPAEGALARFLADERAAPLWGAEVLPGDAMVVYGSRHSLTGAADDAADLMAFLETRTPAPPGTRAALDDLAGSMEGSVIYALWPAQGGGLGAGGALRFAAAASARDRLRAAYGALLPVLPELLGAELGLAANRVELRGSLSRGGDLDGVPVDVVEIAPRYGRDATRERQLFEWLFGARLALGVAVVGDRAVWAAGRDWKPRLRGMISAARGDGRPSLATAPGFVKARAAMPRRGVTFTYIASGSLARFVGDALAVREPLPEHALVALAALRDAPEGSGLVVATRVTMGATAAYELRSVIPNEVLSSLGGMGGAIWRLGLGLMMGPPSLPPLPTPPRLMAPPMTDEPAPPTPPPSSPSSPSVIQEGATGPA